MIEQAHIDLLQLIGGDLRRVARSRGGEWAGPCPFCGGRDRFRVWPIEGRWWCRQCERHGDAVAFVQQRDGVGFRDALRVLELDESGRGVGLPVAPARRPARPPEPQDPPPAVWQDAARALVEQSITRLHGSYQKPLDYLRRRGFTDSTIRRANLGYHPQDRWVDRAAWGLPPDDERTRFWLPRGIVVPWFAGSHLWRVYIRRPAGDPKYYCVPGGSNAIYNADALRAGFPVMLVEAAFDALAIQQEAGDLCAAVATGTTGGRVVRWISMVSGASVVLLAYDNDAGGDTPTHYWRSVLQDRAHVWRPYTDDPSGMLERGWDVRGWVASGVLTASCPEPSVLDEQLLAAARAGDWSLADALAARCADPVGARLFLDEVMR